MLFVIERIIRDMIHRFGYDIVAMPNQGPGGKPSYRDGKEIPDGEFYTPRFSPWNGYGPFAGYYRLAAPYTLVSPDRCWVLYSIALQCLRVPGDFWECGVYKGGTARMLARVIADSPHGRGTKLHLFDTFAGMPETDPAKDWHKAGDFSDTTLAAVRARVGHDESVIYHAGDIPQTFSGLRDSLISFAHIDVDIYQAVTDCCHFILPRLAVGGAVVFDDYGFATCPGARQAVDEFFASTPFVPLVLPTGQAIVFKSVHIGTG
jgi:O-methyltransferase